MAYLEKPGHVVIGTLRPWWMDRLVLRDGSGVLYHHATNLTPVP